jgi:hypothetical protein
MDLKPDYREKSKTNKICMLGRNEYVCNEIYAFNENFL